MKSLVLLVFLIGQYTLEAQEYIGSNRSDETLQFMMQNQLLEVGQQYILDVKAPTLHQYLGYQYTFQFDQNYIEFDSLILTDYASSINLFNSNFNLNFLNSGAFTSIWSTTGISENSDEVLYQIQVTAIENIMVHQAFSIDSELTPVFALCVDGTETQVDLIFDAISRTSQLSQPKMEVFPNPMMHNRLNLNWSFDQKVKDLQIISPLGQVVFTKNGSLLPPLRIDLHEQISGVYFVKLIVEESVVTYPFLSL